MAGDYSPVIMMLKGQRWAVDYEYSLPPEKRLADFGMEQQAAIIADYYYLLIFGSGDFDDTSKA